MAEVPQLVQATGSCGLCHVVPALTGEGGGGAAKDAASHHRGCTDECPKKGKAGKVCSGCHKGFGNITPTTWGALCAEFDRFEAAYKSTPSKPKTRVKYKGRWYRVRKRHQTTCATGLVYQLRPVGGGTRLAVAASARTQHWPVAGLARSRRRGGRLEMAR